MQEGRRWWVLAASLPAVGAQPSFTSTSSTGNATTVADADDESEYPATLVAVVGVVSLLVIGGFCMWAWRKQDKQREKKVKERPREIDVQSNASSKKVVPSRPRLGQVGSVWQRMQGDLGSQESGSVGCHHADTSNHTYRSDANPHSYASQSSIGTSGGAGTLRGAPYSPSGFAPYSPAFYSPSVLHMSSLSQGRGSSTPFRQSPLRYSRIAPLVGVGAHSPAAELERNNATKNRRLDFC
eukprot:TRINITY_DN13449_c0_g2_i1.p1 TRINITY_DN13449_c0_g2~~TRINITY_DN13449_c0_g2_i1.p1  ORF type:complete len:240 (+),score=9.70 TRINITY_DN13449_c0_g2_i1:84-803(+)